MNSIQLRTERHSLMLPFSQFLHLRPRHKYATASIHPNKLLGEFFKLMRHKSHSETVLDAIPERAATAS